MMMNAYAAGFSESEPLAEVAGSAPVAEVAVSAPVAEVAVAGSAPGSVHGFCLCCCAPIARQAPGANPVAASGRASCRLASVAKCSNAGPLSLANGRCQARTQ